MSSEYYDNQYTLISKPVVLGTIDPKDVSPTITVVSKASSPVITVIEDPCIELLAILTEDSYEILHEDSRTMVREG